ncbi:hypothetical protein BpHYR1_014797 [Brachionus plicatilis]|uniref:Uncharacterized protein n=1 Tax=Brachionus plicatilis TaxID=10195 RepID=A0A3M7ST82_BRAPC|nr:hypothetical protein BpHYR1_014797 [Brachionus plicatilis]
MRIITNLIDTCTIQRTPTTEKINLPKKYNARDKRKKDFTKTRKIKKINLEKWNALYENLNKSSPSERKFWKTLNASTENDTDFMENSNITDQEKAEIMADHLEKVLSNKHSLNKNTRNYFKYYKSNRFNGEISTNEI